MPVLGITGGIATGKSTFTRSLLRCLPAEFFDADREAHDLLAGDPAVKLNVEQLFGAESYSPDGHPDRAWLRERVFNDDLLRRQLEEILHPAIRSRWATLAERVAVEGGWLFVDLPLLYETGAADQFDRVIVVACSPTTQRRRLESDRGLPGELAQKILSAQLDLEIKIKRADHLVWNDSTVSSLDGHAELLTGWLRQCYG